MGQNNMKKDETLETLTQDLLESVENHKPVIIHIHSSGLDMADTVYLDDAVIDQCLNLISGHLEINVDFRKSVLIRVERDEYEHNYYIVCENLGIDLCFMD